MLRNSAKYLITAADAAAFLRTKAPAALASEASTKRQTLVPTAMEIFLDHTKDAKLVLDTAKLMTQIDQEAGDSFAIAQHSECLRVLSVVMKQNTQNVAVKEHCCRAMANVCMLPNDTFDVLNGSHSASIRDATTGGTQSATSTPKSFADVAVELGAIELVVGTLSQVSRLSEKGRCWAATALQNLLMFATSPDATMRAGKVGAEDVLASFLVEVCHEATTAMADLQSELRRSVGKTDTEEIVVLTTTLQRLLIAIEAAAVSLARMMNAPAEENANSIETRAQMASASVIEATVRAMVVSLGITTVLTKVQVGDLNGISFSNPLLVGARDESVLPIMHKGWEILKSIVSHKNNLPVVFNAVAEVNADFQPLFTKNEMWLRAAASTTSSPVTSNGAAHKQSVNHILEIIVSHAMLNIATTNLSTTNGVDGGNNNVSRLAFDASLATISDLIAPRADVVASAATEGDSFATNNHNNSNESVDESGIPMAQVVGDQSFGNEGGVLSRSVPTENAAVAIGCIVTGVPATTAVTALPRLWKSLLDMTSEPIVASPTSQLKLTDIDRQRIQAQFETVHDACGYFGLLSNLADAGDTIASSPNAVAIAAQSIADFLQVAQRAHFRIASDKTFLASAATSSTAAPAEILSTNLEKSHAEIVTMQRLLVPVVGKAFTLIWNAVGTPQGSEAIRTMQVAETVKQINKSTTMLLSTLQQKLNDLVALQLEAFNKAGEDGSSSKPTAAAVPSSIIDSLTELERVGSQLYAKLDAIVVNPVYAQNKHDKK